MSSSPSALEVIRSRRNLPRVDDLLADPQLAEIEGSWGRPRLRSAVRRALKWARVELAGGAVKREDLLAKVIELLRAGSTRNLVPVVNATGVVLHTNLGRAPLAAHVLARVVEVASRPCSLEIDLHTGLRGKRGAGIGAALCDLCGAEDALCANNNAAGLFLAVAAIAHGGEVVVSRGELVEIGGSFRLPDVLAISGARLLEVGTTNRTRTSDFTAVFGPATRAVLRVHRSNFHQEGFTESPDLSDLATHTRAARLPLLVDLGHGAMEATGLPDDDCLPRTVSGCLRAGADLVFFSGDKLLGGPQAGLVVGRGDLIGAMRRSPLFRAMRPGKLTIAALEAVLEDHLAGRRDRIPALAQLTEEPASVRRRAKALLTFVIPILESAGFVLEIVPHTSAAGGGSNSRYIVPSFAISIRHPGHGAEGIAARLRSGEPPVLARIIKGAVLLDLRTVPPADIDGLQAALQSLADPAPTDSLTKAQSTGSLL